MAAAAVQTNPTTPIVPKAAVKEPEVSKMLPMIIGNEKEPTLARKLTRLISRPDEGRPITRVG